MRYKLKQLINGVLITVLLLASLPVITPTALAAELSFPTTAGQTLSNGNTYTVSTTRTLTGGTGQSAVYIASNAAVTINIPAGVTLTLNGGAGSGRTGGGAGIYLPNNSTLYIRGGGTLIAKGGSSGTPASGGSGGGAFRSGSDSGNYAGVTFTTGSGGAGGYGGGSPGAGIGGAGQSGGTGGTGGASKSVSYLTDSQGNQGKAGGSGSGGTEMGTLYLLDTVKVTATAGTRNIGSASSGGGDYSRGWFHESWSRWQGLGSGGGGGAGGYSGISANIGGSGGGGGGGAGGNSGSAYYVNTWQNCYFYVGSPGGGGGGYGSAGKLSTNYAGYNGTNSIDVGAGNSGGIVKSSNNAGGGSDINGGSAASANGYGPVGVVGGSRGSGGAGGTVYKSPTATLNSVVGGSTTYIADGKGAKLNTLPTVTLDRQGGSGGTSSVSTYIGASMPAITPPNPPSASAGAARFSGYFAGKGGSGAKYYDSNGSGLRNFDFNANTTLYAYWTYLLTFNNQGVSNTTAQITKNTPFPASITIPQRTGYSFHGYYGDINGEGTEYYNAEGTRAYDSNWDRDAGLTIYAHWQKQQNTLNIDPSGGTWNGEASPASITKGGGTRLTLADPENDKKPFLGWTQSGTGGRLEGNVFVFDIGDPVTLTARWGIAPTTAFNDQSSLNASGADGKASDLEEVYNHTVTESDKGVTLEDLNAGEVTLTLIVSDANEESPGADEIISTAQGKAVNFFDISVEKHVSGEKPIKLTEIPISVQVRIPLTDDLADKAGYSVYRYHDEQTQRLSVDPNAEEHFKVEDDAIVIHTRKFSTYAVVAHEISIAGNSDIALLDAQHDSSGWDVQAIVREPGSGAYKIDIAWGAMAFDYSIGRYWNPETHSYDGDQIYAWLPDGYFSNGNNKITAYNHSNMDISVTFGVVSELAGVDMTVYAENSDAEDTPLAIDLMLPKVPYETAPSPSIDAFLRLTGTPTDTSNVNGGYKKVGVITVTLDAIPDNGTTPAGSP